MRSLYKEGIGTDDLASVSLAMEAIGDITASAEVSRVEVDGEEFDSRIQGGVRASHSQKLFGKTNIPLGTC